MSNATMRSELVRVSVSSGTRRVDLVLPGVVPLAELVPELARGVGLLDAATVHGGYRVVTAQGRLLSLEAGLISQGVVDGGLLVVGAGIDEPPPRCHDDVVETMAEAVERDLPTWTLSAARRTALVTAGLLMALSAVALLLAHTSPFAGPAAVGVAGGLLAGAIVLSRAASEPAAALVVAWLGCAYAAQAGLMLTAGAAEVQVPTLPGHQVAGAGGGLLLAGVVCVVGLDAGRTFLLPAVVVGATLLGAGLLSAAGSIDVAVVLTAALAIAVLGGSAFPSLALGLAGGAADPAEVDAVQVSADAQVAHQLLVAISATLGLLLVLVAPLAVGLGLAGTMLAVVSCLVLMLRTRLHRSGQEVLVGLGSGVLGLVSVAVSVLWLHPEWRFAVAGTLAATGAVVLIATLGPVTHPVRRGRLGDLAATCCLLALPPLAVLATGLYAALGGPWL